jgi:uncharacterized membrane protein YbhN (UPF0104 family)
VDAIASIAWTSLAIALALHVGRLGLRCVAWRNILRASYPDHRVHFWGVAGAYVAGVGVNSIVPARGGDALKLFLAKRSVEGSRYPTLGATLIPETMFDSAVAAVIVGWALASGALPGPSELLHLPTVDWSWPYRHQYVTAIFLAVLIVGGTVALLGLEDRLGSFWARVGQGFAILRNRRRYVLEVVSWQTGSWVLRFASVYWFLKAFHMPASSRNVLLVLAVQSISTLLPITPGGVGTVQGLLVFAFRGKVAAATVLGFSVGMHIATVATNVVLGFAAIGTMLGTLRWRRLVGRDRPLAEH